MLLMRLVSVVSRLELEYPPTLTETYSKLAIGSETKQKIEKLLSNHKLKLLTS